MEYDLELERVIEEVKKQEAKIVCIQLPDGLKPQAAAIQEAIEKNTPARVIIWAGPCYGACDMPMGVTRFGVDLLVHWGHTQWR